MQNKTWNKIPKEIPKLVVTAEFLPYRKDCLETRMKSGPGLITANKCAEAIIRNCSNIIILNFVPRAGIEPARLYIIEGF